MSTYEYPPISRHKKVIEDIIKPYKTLCDGKTALYISTPMTSGIKYMEAFDNLQDQTKGLSDEVKDSFFKQNCAHASHVAKGERVHKTFSLIIDPTQFSMSGWEQNDYLDFWGKVITRYVREIRFVNDWQYSNGCAYEFLVGVLTKTRLTHENGMHIGLCEGRDMIQDALKKQLVGGYDNKFIASVLKSLNAFIDDDGA